MSEQKRNFRLSVQAWASGNNQAVFDKTVNVEQESLSRKAQSLVASAIGKGSDEILIYLKEMKEQ